MRRIASSILVLGLVVAVVGCGSMQFNVSEPQAAQMTFKKNNILWESWEKTATSLPATLTLNANDKYIFKIDNVPLHNDLTIYGVVQTKGTTNFTKVAQVPIIINAQDVQDIERGNVVRIVIVDPKKELQTSQFESLRLSPTQDAYKEGKKMGKVIAVVTLGNRQPKFMDIGGKRKAASY